MQLIPDLPVFREPDCRDHVWRLNLRSKHMPSITVFVRLTAGSLLSLITQSERTGRLLAYAAPAPLIICLVQGHYELKVDDKAKNGCPFAYGLSRSKVRPTDNIVFLLIGHLRTYYFPPGVVYTQA